MKLIQPKALPSVAMRLAANRELWGAFRDRLTNEQAAALKYDWGFWGRPSQHEPTAETAIAQGKKPDWTTWLFLGGRGVGKTRSGAEWIRKNVESGTMKRIALVGSDAGDVRRVIVEGESGLLKTASPWFQPTYEPSKRQLTWPNGALATIFTGAEPDQLRGPQHDGCFCDEICKWLHPQETWDNLQFGMRLGARPRQIVTTTPRSMKLLRDIINRDDTVITRGTTFENAANLAPAFLTAILAKYKGTRLGRQEIDGDLLEDVPGALWSRAKIDECRRTQQPVMKRIVVAIDPPASSGEGADECGIIVAGIDYSGEGWVLADLSEGGLKPHEWARKAISGYEHFEADSVVVEINQGGEMCSSVLRHENSILPIKTVHASRGKVIRAEPVAMVYEQGRVHHLGSFPVLEDQLCAFTKDYDRDKDGSPDRLDACVWAFTELMPGKRAREFSIT